MIIIKSKVIGAEMPKCVITGEETIGFPSIDETKKVRQVNITSCDELRSNTHLQSDIFHAEYPSSGLNENEIEVLISEQCQVFINEKYNK